MTLVIEPSDSCEILEFRAPAWSKHIKDCQLLRLKESPMYIIFLPWNLLRKPSASNLQASFRNIVFSSATFGHIHYENSAEASIHIALIVAETIRRFQLSSNNYCPTNMNRKKFNAGRGKEVIVLRTFPVVRNLKRFFFLLSRQQLHQTPPLGLKREFSICFLLLCTPKGQPLN